MAIIFDGRKLAAEKEEKLTVAVAEFKKAHGFAPKLVSILVGDNPTSVKYLAIKKTIGERVGMEFEEVKFEEDTKLTKLTKLIETKNKDSKVHGIMIQMPIPKKFLIFNFQFLINPSKDVDCLTTENLRLLTEGRPRFLPATTKAVLEIVQSAKCKVQSAKIVVVGAKGFVGKPLFDYLRGLGLKVVGVDQETKDLGSVTLEADILISATGVPGLIKKDMVKKGAAVIDVGYPSSDVDFAAVAEVASFITPVPGGVGPLTVISLLENVLLAAKNIFLNRSSSLSKLRNL